MTLSTRSTPQAEVQEPRLPGPDSRSIAGDSARTVVIRVLSYGTAFLSSIVVSRFLGPAGRGQYYLPFVTATTLSTICALGIEHANVAVFGSRGASLERLWRQAGAVAFTVGTLGAAATIVAPVLLPALFGSAPMLGYWIAALTIPFALHTQFTAGLLTLRGMVTWQFKATLLGSAVQVVVLTALAFSGVLSVVSVLLVALGVGILTWAAMLVPFGGVSGLRVEVARSLLRETLRQAIPLHAASVILFLHLRADMFMVEAYKGTAALGLYSLAVTLAETVSLVTDSLSIAILPRQTSNSLDNAARLALRGARTNLLIGLLLSAGWAAFGWFLIPAFFGRDFLDSYQPLVVLLPGIVLLGMQRVCGGALIRSGHPWRIASIQGVSLATNVALNLWLIPALGSTGAALASAVSYALGASIFLAWTSRLAGLPAFSAVLPGSEDVRGLWTHAVGALCWLRAASGARRNH